MRITISSNTIVRVPIELKDAIIACYVEWCADGEYYEIGAFTDHCEAIGTFEKLGDVYNISPYRFTCDIVPAILRQEGKRQQRNYEKKQLTKIFGTYLNYKG